MFFSIFTLKSAWRHNRVLYLISPFPIYLRTRRFSKPTFAPPEPGRPCNSQGFCLRPFFELLESHVLQGQRVIYTGLAWGLCLDLLKIPRCAGPRRGRSCNLPGICYFALVGPEIWSVAIQFLQHSKHVFGAIATYLPWPCARPWFGIFTWSWPRHLGAAQQQYWTSFLRLEEEPFLASPWRALHVYI